MPSGFPKDGEHFGNLFGVAWHNGDQRGVFDRIVAALAGAGPKCERIMIYATHPKARRTAAKSHADGVGRTFTVDGLD